MRKKFLHGLWANTGDLGQFRAQVPAASPFSMKRDCESMTLIADLLNQSKNRRSFFKNNGVIFAAGNVDDLLTLCDACQRLIDNIKGIQSGLGRMQLSQTAVVADAS